MPFLFLLNLKTWKESQKYGIIHFPAPRLRVIFNSNNNIYGILIFIIFSVIKALFAYNDGDYIRNTSS